MVTGDNPTVLEDVKQDMGRLSETTHKFAFDIVFAPLKQQLSDLASQEVGVVLLVVTITKYEV